MTTFTPHHPDKGPWLRELRPEQRLVGFYLVRSKQLEDFRDRSRGQFLTLVLSDRTGNILARVWEDGPALAETFEVGAVIKIGGDVEQYQGRTQLIVNRLRAATPEEFDVRDFLPSTTRDIDELLDELRQVIAQVQHPPLAALLAAFFDDNDFIAQFSQAPAGRQVHHAYLGGMLEHTLEVARLAAPLLEIYPELDADLLLTGILLHDVGKVRELTWHPTIDYSDEGRLIGHVILTEELLTARLATIADFPPELALRLRHMLLSHHGRYEYGSPRRPKTLEAIALHTLENVSAQVNRFKELLESRREIGDHWTHYDRLLGRSLYSGPGDDDLTIEESSYEE